MAHVTDADAHSQDLEVAAQLMQATTRSYRTTCLWITLCILWFIVTSFTLTGFVFAFYWDIMFRFAFIVFSWFITIINLPFILRAILKSFSLYYPQMDQFKNNCIYCLNRFMYIIFIVLNVITSVLLISDKNGKFWMACFFIGIHNVIFAFKFGTYLAMRSTSSNFHGSFFLFLCLSIATATYINGSTEKGILIFAPLVIWVVVWCIFVVMQSTTQRTQDEYFHLAKRKAMHRAKKQKKQLQLYQQKVELGVIDIDAAAASQSPSFQFQDAAAPKMLSLRLNHDKKSDHDLFMLYEQNNASNPQIANRKRVQSLDSVYDDAPQQKEQALRYKQTRHVTCCCGKFICGLRTCLQIQTIITAASIWGSFALFLLDKISWTCYILMIFIAVTTIYNPICYTKRCSAIRTSKACCTGGKCCLCCAYFFGLIVVLIAASLCALLFVIANPFSVSNIEETIGGDLDDKVDEFWQMNLSSTATKLGLMYSVWGIAFLSFFNYLPGAGWVFYQIPVGFPFINFVSFVLCLIVPMVLNNAFGEEIDPCLNESFTCHIKNNSVNWLYNSLYNGYSHRMEDVDSQRNLLYIPHLTALVSFTIYLSLTGLGCSWYRFKKAIVESQAKLTGNKKGQQSKEFGMTLIMASTLSIAFGDVVSDAWYAFGTKDEDWASPALKWLAVSLFCMQIVIQVFSFNDVIHQLRKSLASKQSLPHCECCYKWCKIFYLILTLPYLIIVFIIAMILGVTKLFSIKQVQEWWFKLLISGYGEHVQVAKKKQRGEKIMEVYVDAHKEQPSALHSDSSHVDGMTQWQCSQCTQMNNNTSNRCVNCGIDREHAQIRPTVSSMNAPLPMIDVDAVIGSGSTDDDEGQLVNDEHIPYMNNDQMINPEAATADSDSSTSSSVDNMVNNVSAEPQIAPDDPNTANINSEEIDVQHANIESNSVSGEEDIVPSQDAMNKWSDNQAENDNDDVADVDDVQPLNIQAAPNFREIIKLKTAAEEIQKDYDDEDVPTPVTGHYSKQSTQFENIVKMVTAKSVKTLPGFDVEVHEADVASKPNNKQSAWFSSQSAANNDVTNVVMSARSVTDTYKDDKPLMVQVQSNSIRASIGGIHDVTTPKMEKFRRKYQDTHSSEEEEEEEEEEDQVADAESDEDEDENSKANKEDRYANILDEDGAWLGYEISENSLLWKAYLFIDSFTPLWMSRLKVRANVYNSYFISELIIESWPQLVTNLVNSYYQGFSDISYISACFSLLMISHTMLKIIYYVGVRKKDLDKFVL